MTWNGHPIVVVKAGIFLTLIEYKDLFTKLSRMTRPGGASCRQFRVLTTELELENERCHANTRASKR